MKKLVSHLPLALLLVGCGGGKTSIVEVQNLSAKRFDSVQIFLCTGSGGQPVVNFGPMLPGQAMPPLAMGNLIKKYHEEWLGSALFFTADTIIRRYGPYNEGMPMYNHYKITINDSLQVKWAEYN